MQRPAPTTVATAVATVFRLLAAVLVVITGLVRPGGVLAAEPAAAAADRHPELKRLSPAEEVWIDPATRRVVVGGRVALDKGVIEYFACPADTGKEHESVVTVGSTARLVHAALLAIGLEPGHPASFDPEYVAARGPIAAVPPGVRSTVSPANGSSPAPAGRLNLASRGRCDSPSTLTTNGTPRSIAARRSLDDATAIVTIGGRKPACMIQLASMPRSAESSRQVTTNRPLGIRPSMVATASSATGSPVDSRERWSREDGTALASPSGVGLVWVMGAICRKGGE
jgi:hypothetical protein